MARDYDIGCAAAQQGSKAPPKADNYVQQQQRDAGFNHQRQPPPLPPSRPAETNGR